MRIADKMNYDQVKNNLAKNRLQMAELQNQAATQKRVTKPSDDPVAAARVLGERVDLMGNKQFSKNLDYARSFLEFTDQALSELTENLMRVKELAISQANDASANEHSRSITATEVEQILNQVIQVGNRKMGERFIFGGYQTTIPPFSLKGHYQGDHGEILIHTNKGSHVAMNLPGSQVFLGVAAHGSGLGQVASEQPQTVEELLEQRQKSGSETEPSPSSDLDMRSPASSAEERMVPSGVNIFNLLKGFEIALRTNDKEAIQDMLVELDEAVSQVVMARSRVGSRGMALDNVRQSLDKAKVDNQVSISQLEDADIFSTISEINKNEATLQATLQTSGKLIQPTLMSFLR